MSELVGNPDFWFPNEAAKICNVNRLTSSMLVYDPAL